MSSKALKSIDAGLSPSQINILEKKKLSGSYKVSKLIKLLKKVSLYDEVNDQLCASLKTRFIVCLVVGIIVTLVSIFFPPFRDVFAPFPFAYLLKLLLFGAAGYFYFRRQHLLKRDLGNDLREFLFPFAALVQEDVRPDTTLQLDVDARDPVRKEFFVDKTGTSSRQYKNYHQQWLEGDLTLVDNAKLFFKAEKFVSKVKITKTNMRGKRKTKHKIKFKGIAQLRMVVSKSQYELTGQSAANVSVTELDDSFVVKAKYKYKDGKLVSLPIYEFINLIHSMYSTLKPVA